MVGAVGLSAACSDQDAASAPASTAAAIPTGTHIHAAVRDPADGTLLVATHTGLFKKSDNGLTSIGPAIDLMGFAVAGDGTYYASGHPGMQTDLPQPLGLVRSTDGGATWDVMSRGGQSDFHALAVSQKKVVGFDGALRHSPDGKAWTTLPIPQDPISLAYSPDGSTVLAATGTSLLESDTGFDAWKPVNAAPAAVLVTYADAETIVVLDQDARLHRSNDGGTTWTAGAAPIPSATSLSASRLNEETVEVLLGSGDGVLSTIDLGATTTALV